MVAKNPEKEPCSRTRRTRVLADGRPVIYTTHHLHLQDIWDHGSVHMSREKKVGSRPSPEVTHFRVFKRCMGAWVYTSDYNQFYQ